MAVTAQQISWFAGESVVITFTPLAATDITGWSITFTIKRNKTDANADALLTQTIGSGLTVISLASGTFKSTITHAQTAAIGIGPFVFDVQRTDSGSEAEMAIGTGYAYQPVRN